MSGTVSERARRIADEILSAEKYGAGGSELLDRFKNNKPLMYGSIALVAALAVGGGVLLWKKHKKGSF